MASATVDSTTAAATAITEPPLQVDSIPTVDLHLLSQSELYSLSLCSPSSFDPLRGDDVVVPKIDRSVFNESAGSRKQTYSRLRLAPASAATSASSIRRRTPHLRHTSNLPYQYLDTDPDKDENQQILALLKQLFGLDSSICVSDDRNEELVPIRVDYSHSLPQFTNDSHLVLQLANVGVTGQKRKRGRPRKNENATVLVENKVESQSNNDNLVGTMSNAIVVYQNENVEDKDKEILNRDGFEVDLVALAAMEDPYGVELRRRTEGMETEEALLEFLRCLNGQWGSRRKKKRIVDASEFGSALPRGWALLLSVKKKDGRAWLFCRRYISPNGRQFVSCKEISSYLLSLRGIQVANQLTSNQINAEQTANNTVFVNTVGEATVDKKIGVNPVCQISPAVASTPGNFVVEVTLNTGEDMPGVQVGEVLHCDKCEMTFIAQDDLLQHQSCHRRRRSKNGESVTDGVIIRDGKFECQICHKTFLERHRYNGHMGAHVRNQVKFSDQNRATNVKDSLGTGTFDVIPPGSLGKTSDALESYIATGNPWANADHVLNTYSLHCSDKQHGDRNESNDMVRKVDKAIDVDVLKHNLPSNSQAGLHNNGNNDFCGTAEGSSAIKGVAIGNEAGVKMPHSESCRPAVLDKIPGRIDKTVTGPSVDMEEPKVQVDAGIDFLENVDIGLDDGHLSHKVIEIRLVGNKYDADESNVFDKKHDGLDVTSGIGHLQHSEAKDHLCRNDDNLDGKLICNVFGSKQDTSSDYMAPCVDKEKCYDNVLNYTRPSPSSMVVGQEDNRIYPLVGKESHSAVELTKDSPTGLQEERNIGTCTVPPSWNEQVNFIEKYNDEVSTCFLEGHEQPKDSGSSLPSISSFQENCGVPLYSNRISARQMWEPKVNDVQNVRNNGLFPFSCSSDPMNMDSITSSKNGRRPEFRSFFPSASAGDNIDDVHNNLSEQSGKPPSGSVLLTQSFTAEASQQPYDMNKIFAPQVDECKLTDTGYSKFKDLSLASDSQPYSKNVQLEGFPAENFDIQSGIKQVSGVQSNLNNTAHNGPDNHREARAFGIDLHGPAFGDQTCDFDNRFNMIYQGKVWEGPKIDDVENSGNKFIIGFDGGNTQPVEDVMSGSIWRTGEGNFLQTGLANTSTPLEESSNSFRNFDIISQKGDRLFGVNQNYEGGTGFEGLRLGRSNPVEYSFMTAQSSNSIPGENKGFSYDVNTGQQYDSSFWLGMDALMPNVTGQNPVPTFCVWCRNEFYQEEPVPSGAEAGAIGSMCPACSSKISQRFNVL
ncbi:uncharacterized protein [Coffea arabica]|uniref:Methyl-CpG-binding domain-containing protein 8-like n=1 Tax=Coffea arabica TaxID=13443 RepID=A0A6P6USL2_COFAR